MPVKQVTSRMQVEANTVYVTPPNTMMGIFHGTLQLLPRPVGSEDLAIGSLFDATDLQRAEKERLRVLSELHAERTRFEAVLRQLPAGVMVAEAPSGKVVLANDQARRILLLHGAELNLSGNRTADSLLMRRKKSPLLRALHAGETIVDEEVPVKTAAESISWLSISAAPVRDTEGKIVAAVATMHDITERKRAAAALQDATNQLLAVLNTVPGAVSWISRDLHYLGVNKYLASLFGVTPQAFIGRKVGFLKGNPEFLRFVRGFFASARVRQSQEIRVDIGPLGKSAQPRVYLIVGQKYQRGARAVLVGIDITERKQNERERERLLTQVQEARGKLSKRVEERTAALQVATHRQEALSARLVETQEAERRHLARELHDEIGQVLTGLKLLLETAPQQSGKGQDPLHEAQGIVSDLLQQVRQLSINLRPQILDDLGLLVALEWYFQTYERRTRISVRFGRGTVKETVLSPELKTTIFRVVQEALTNIARHAQVSAASVRLRQSKRTLELKIGDQGVGFHPTKALDNLTSGLSGMQERVRLVGGQFKVVSRPGRGTLLTATVPIGGDKKKQL